MAVTHERVTKWLNDYVDAWKSNDPKAIAALFSEDASYRYHPFDTPVHGRDKIIESWLENPDDPNRWRANYDPIAVEGNTAVANGRTVYFEADGSTIRDQFDNIFVIRFDDAGLCCEFSEWFVRPRGSSS